MTDPTGDALRATLKDMSDKLGKAKDIMEWYLHYPASNDLQKRAAEWLKEYYK